jgi:hypothetical protein
MNRHDEIPLDDYWRRELNRRQDQLTQKHKMVPYVGHLAKCNGIIERSIASACPHGGATEDCDSPRC